MRIVDDCPAQLEPITVQERSDLAAAHDSALYQAMLEKVEAEMWQAWRACGELRGAEPAGRKIHDEAMRRLRRDASD